jgi:uncharacterized protein YabE (DUF348 family)
MLSDQEKKEMLADGLSLKRQQEFSVADRRKTKTIRTVSQYIAFLMEVQKIKAFQHDRVVTAACKNIL